MNLFSRRLFRTTAVRAALLYGCAFGLLAALGMSFIYWTMKNQVMSQVDARLRLEADVLLSLYDSQALPALIESVRRRSRDEENHQLFFYLLWGPDRSYMAGKAPRGLSVASLSDDGVQLSYRTLRAGDVLQSQPDDKRWVRVLSTVLPGNYRLVIGRGLDEQKALLDHTLTVIIAVSIAIALLALAISLVLGQRALRRIDQISHITGAFIAGDLSRRLPLSRRGHNDEFDQLSRRLNVMLERTGQLLVGMRQVTDNISHDLRKPLSRLRNRLEVTLLEARSEDEYRAVLEDAIRDADELLKTFNALLSIAQAEAGIKRNQWAQVDLGMLSEDVVELYDAVAEQAEIRLVHHVEPGLRAMGNRQLLAQALGNLVDNAVKYTPAGGQITIAATRLDGVPALSVSDTGPGIPATEHGRVFDRFVRLDTARRLPGNGLGLSLVKAVAGLHDARLTLADNNPGLRVELRFEANGLDDNIDDGIDNHFADSAKDAGNKNRQTQSADGGVGALSVDRLH